MFWLYEVTDDNSRRLFDKRRPSHLFGRNQGLIATLLRSRLPPMQVEDYAWHINLECATELKGQGFVIELMPKKGSEFSLFQVCDAWGYSCDKWTPGMLRLRDLSMGDKKSSTNEQGDFEIGLEEQHKNIFTFVYFAGTVKAGTLDGTWNPPGPSPTNSVLLWPETFEYFTSEARKFGES